MDRVLGRKILSKEKNFMREFRIMVDDAPHAEWPASWGKKLGRVRSEKKSRGEPAGRIGQLDEMNRRCPA